MWTSNSPEKSAFQGRGKTVAGAAPLGRLRPEEPLGFLDQAAIFRGLPSAFLAYDRVGRETSKELAIGGPGAQLFKVGANVCHRMHSAPLAGQRALVLFSTR
jgi:hypothetical protein